MHEGQGGVLALAISRTRLQYGVISGLAQDVGCCFGQELRKAILDGIPEANVVASDLTSEYWCVFFPCSRHLNNAVLLFCCQRISELCAAQGSEAA